jgi:putative FmdB family regulatory protein
MPVYEYICDNCSCRFEIKQGFKDRPEATCPQCNKPARRLISSVPIIFKGSGFYVTDNGSTGKEAYIGSKKDGEKAKTPELKQEPAPVAPKTTTKATK